MNVTSKRNDIQGLRAVAVVAVVLYHFGIGPFSGGFIGVDVFFVISGYLITAKIAREVESGRFSFVEFCSGRARRLLPALFATIAVAFIVGACLFAPLDFQRQSAATIAAMLGASNILFWYEAGYFDAAAILILLSEDKGNVDDTALMSMSETMGMALEKLVPVRNHLQGVDWMEGGSE